MDNIVLNSTRAQLRQNLLYLYSFLYSLPDGGVLEAETCRRDITHDELLFIINFAICCIKYCVYIRTFGT